MNSNEKAREYFNRFIDGSNLKEREEVTAEVRSNNTPTTAERETARRRRIIEEHQKRKQEMFDLEKYYEKLSTEIYG